LGSSFDVNKAQSSSSLAMSAVTNVVYNGSIVNLSGTSIKYYSSLQTWGTDVFASQNVGIVLDVRPAGVYGQSFNYALLQNFTFVPTYQVYNDLEAKSEMSELTIRFSSVTVNTVTRKMRAHWTPELAQDLEAYHSIDAEAELTALLSEEIAAEIDREIIRDLVQGAMFEARWDYAGLRNNANFFGTQKDWNQTLVTRVNELSAQIHKATLRGGANWIICSAEAGAIFDDLEYFHVDSSASPETEKYNLVLRRSVTLETVMLCTKTHTCLLTLSFLDTKEILFRGRICVRSIYSIAITATIYDPRDFTPRKGIMTRYAKKMINNRFYGVIILDNLTLTHKFTHSLSNT
jgi:hypothetical protein